MAALGVASACCLQPQTQRQAESASMLVMQDMDVETLMQEIKQWGPQDQAPQVQDQAPQVQDQAPQLEAIMNEPESQSPGRLSLDKTDQPSSSSMQVDTPDHSQTQMEEEEEASSSSDKASFESCQCWSFLVTFAKACMSHLTLQATRTFIRSQQQNLTCLPLHCCIYFRCCPSL